MVIGVILTRLQGPLEVFRGISWASMGLVRRAVRWDGVSVGE